jgi:hypothetical protein
VSEPVIFALLAVIVLLLLARTLQRWSRDQQDPFELRDLFMENGRASRGAVVMLGAFASTTLFFLYYTAMGRMTEGYFGLYSAAWIVPTVARMLTGSPPAPPKVAA